MTLAEAGQPALRLTRRGRVVFVGLFVIAAALVWFASARGADATATGASPVQYGKNLSQVVVERGDSLWSIAVRAEPDADPRLVIQQITDLNALPGAVVVPGQRLWVPKG
jgi:nucleoid-associated protein YgaU